MNRFSGSDFRKILWFAGCGAAGALVAALLGEVWLWATQGSPRIPTIGLVLDCSGSMFGPKLAEMKSAAVDFVDSKAFATSPISVTEFESGARVACPLTTDRKRLVQTLQALNVSGGTNMSAGLTTALGTMPATGLERYMVIFTDGMPDSEELALQAANACRSTGIRLIAVGTGDARGPYLQQLTADPKLVFTAKPGEFAKAFQQVEQTLQTLVGSSSVSGGLWSPLRIGVWTAILAFGIGMCLIGGQNLYLGKPAWSGAAWWLGLIGCPLAGFAAGFIGELAFLGVASTTGFLLALVRFIGWVFMGGLLGAGLARVIPNLKITRGLMGGAIGGALGVLGFGLIGLLLAEMLGRWAGAGIVGFCIGAMIAWIDAWLREASLEIDYGKGETRSVSLGREPVTVGSVAGKCTVYIPAPTPTTLRMRLDQGQVLCEDVEQGKTAPFLPNETRQVGKATLKIRGMQAIAGAPSTPLPQAVQARTATNPSRSTSINTSTALIPDSLLLVIAWNQFPLTVGTQFTGKHIAGLEPDAPGDLVAEVQANPQDPQVLGLKNRSRIAWQATNAAGIQLTIDPGRSVRIAAGTVVQFGRTEGKIQNANP
jgi:Ca-activated chloride channel family protein